MKKRSTSGKASFLRRLPNQIQEVARRKLRMLHNAQRIEDLRIPPNNCLETLKGKRAGQWRIFCFLWHVERLLAGLAGGLRY
jgi:proteic killer suppression protein